MAKTPPLMKQYTKPADVKISFPQRETFREQYEKQNSVNRVGRPYTKYYIEIKQYTTTANISSDCGSNLH